ncbi:MAG: cytochrome c peroxidase [Chitinophagales bacterium]
MNKLSNTALFILTSFVILQSCSVDPEMQDTEDTWVYDPTPYEIVVPTGLPPFPYNLLNPGNDFTIAGVELGRMLFYDPILSADSTLSCSGCHNFGHAFSDTTAFSIGIDGLPGKRNAMPLYNLAYAPYDNGFFWDGRALTLEDQALMPIQDPLEMHNTLPAVVEKLNNSLFYQEKFYNAFGTSDITPALIGDAIAQFTKSIVSANSRYDQAARGEIFLTDQETHGYELFNDLAGGDCFHCHGVNGGLFTDYIYRNNGLDPATHYTDFIDAGRGAVTGDTSDYGKFKTPSLRNIELTAPYMHDGRFQTLEEVLDFYSTGVHAGPFTDNFMQFAPQGGVQLTEEEKADIIAFLKALTDEDLKNNPAYQDPFK